MTFLGHDGMLLYDIDLFLTDHVHRDGPTIDDEIISLHGAESRVEVQFELPSDISIARPDGESLSLKTAVNIALGGQNLPDGTLQSVATRLCDLSRVLGDSQFLDGLSTDNGLDDVGRERHMAL